MTTSAPSFGKSQSYAEKRKKILDFLQKDATIVPHNAAGSRSSASSTDGMGGCPLGEGGFVLGQVFRDAVTATA